MTTTVTAAAGGLTPALDGFRLTLHVLAAAVWVGGQITVAGLLPTLRTLGEDAPRKAARAFGRVEWPAFALLVLTGFWNLVAVKPSTQSQEWNAVLGIKMVMVLLAGVAVLLHQRSKTRTGLAVWGAIGAVTSLAALALGVFLGN